MKKIILDTCVFIKLKGSKNFRETIELVLLRHKDAQVHISEMTRFEFIRHCQNLNDVQKAIALLDGISGSSFEVNKDMLAYATHYYRVLVKFAKPDGTRAISTNQLSDSDIIIGATAIRYGTLLCTTDRNDFPAPFFEEVSVDAMDGKQKLYVLKADTKFYDQQFALLHR